MALLDKIKYGIDLPRWQSLPALSSPTAPTHAAGVSWCADKRNDLSSYQIAFQLLSASVANVYFTPSGFNQLCNPGISAFGAGSTIENTTAMTYVGSIGAGCSTTKIITTTNNGTWATNGALVSKNFGFRIRIIGNAAGSSGKVEERYIVANTSGTTPTFYLNSALSFTPANGDTYEIMAYKVFFLGTTAGATQLRVYRSGIGDVASAGNTTLTVATESNFTALDENLVPYDMKPGEGFLKGASTYDTGAPKGCLVATGSAAGTLTGETSAGDYDVIANEYRNYQIRIVEDTAIPTAVNQRRIIASHTAGANPVYTLGSNWAVTPSTTAKYVIENPNVIILFTVAAGTTTYTYNPTAYTINNGTNSITAGAFSTAYFGARGTVIGAGAMAFPSYGHRPTKQTDGARLSRHSYLWSFRGGGVSTLDMLDIAGGTTGAWTNAIAYNNGGVTFTTGACGDYAPTDQYGRWAYFCEGGGTINRMYRFDVEGLGLYPWCPLPAQSGTAAVGKRVFVVNYQNGAVGGTDKLSLIHVQGHLSTAIYRSEAII